MIVKNVTDAEICVMWNGANIYFGAGQKKLFTDEIGSHIVNESKGLEIEDENAINEVKEVKEVEVIEEVKDVFSTRETKNGITQYLKNGKMIKKAEYDAR